MSNWNLDLDGLELIERNTNLSRYPLQTEHEKDTGVTAEKPSHKRQQRC